MWCLPWFFSVPPPVCCEKPDRQARHSFSLPPHCCLQQSPTTPPFRWPDPSGAQTLLPTFFFGDASKEKRGKDLKMSRRNLPLPKNFLLNCFLTTVDEQHKGSFFTDTVHTFVKSLSHNLFGKNRVASLAHVRTVCVYYRQCLHSGGLCFGLPEETYCRGQQTED